MLTALFSGNTPHSALFILTQDGGAGNTLVLTNAALIAAAPAGTPIGDLLRRFVADQAEAQRIMQGIGLDIPPETDKLVGRLVVHAQSGSGAAPGTIAVSADAAANQIQLLALCAAAASQWLLYIDVLHSLVR